MPEFLRNRPRRRDDAERSFPVLHGHSFLDPVLPLVPGVFGGPEQV